MSHPLTPAHRPRGVDSVALAHQARLAGISIAPGPLFSPADGFRNYIRLNAGYAWNERIERAIGVLGKLVQQAGPSDA